MKLQDMPGIVILFVMIAIILGVGATILMSVKSGQCGDVGTWNATGGYCMNATGQEVYSDALNATAKGLEGITEISTWQPTLAIIVIAAVVIGVIGYFYVAGKRQ
jgi:hypothetical protein